MRQSGIAAIVVVLLILIAGIMSDSVLRLGRAPSLVSPGPAEPTTQLAPAPPAPRPTAPPSSPIPAPPPPTPSRTPAEPPSQSPSRDAVAPARTPSRAKPPAESPLDAALKSLVQGHVAFNSPETMRVGETGEIQALLSVSISGEQLMAELTAAGKRESDTLLVSDHMQATLAGGGAFDVSPTGPQSQWISQSETTRWHWDVTPKLTGPQVLTLTLDAILTINGDKDTRNITTLTRQIDVRVSRPHGVGEWFARIKDIIEAIGWGWGVIVAVAGVLMKFRRRLRDWFRGTGKPPDSAPEDVDRD